MARYNSTVEYNGPGEENVYKTIDVPKRNGRHDANPAALKNLKYLQQLQQLTKNNSMSTLDDRGRRSPPLYNQYQNGPKSSMQDIVRGQTELDYENDRQAKIVSKLSQQYLDTDPSSPQNGVKNNPLEQNNMTRPNSNSRFIDPSHQNRYMSNKRHQSMDIDNVSPKITEHHIQNPIKVNMDYEVQKRRQQFDADKLMLEADPHLLEEQRYLERLKRFEKNKIERFVNHQQNFTLPELERKKAEDNNENKMIQRRIQTYADYQEKQKSMREELVQINSRAIVRQIDSRHAKTREEQVIRNITKQNVDNFGMYAREYYQRRPMNHDQQVRELKEIAKENEYKSNLKKGQGNAMKFELQGY